MPPRRLRIVLSALYVVFAGVPTRGRLVEILGMGASRSRRLRPWLPPSVFLVSFRRRP